MEAVNAGLKHVAATSAPFTLTLADFGAFPTLAHPRIFWIGLSSATGQLTTIQQQV